MNAWQPDGAPTAAYLEQRRRITSLVKNRLIEVLQLDLSEEQIGFDSPLFGAGLGLDSVDAVGLAAAIEQEFGVPVLDSDIQVFRSINTIVDFVMTRQAQAEEGEAPAEMEAVVVPADLGERAIAPDGHAEELGDYVAFRTQAGLLDVSADAKIQLGGEDAQLLLDLVVAGNVSDMAIGDMLHSLCLADDGSILALVWAARTESGFLLFTGSRQRTVMLDLLARHRGELAVEIQDVTGDYGFFAVVGPRAQDLVVDLFDEDLLRLGYAELSQRDWNGVPVVIARFGEVGELDFRLLVPRDAAALLQAEIEDVGSMHGLRTCRSAVFPALMLEMKSIHQDTALPVGSAPSEVDLQWMVQVSKERFAGREAALAGLGRAERRSLVLVAEGTDDDTALDRSLTGREVWLGNRRVGRVQTDAISYTLGRRIALALVDDDVAWPNLPFVLPAGSGSGEEAVRATSRSAPLFLTRTVVESLNL